MARKSPCSHRGRRARHPLDRAGRVTIRSAIAPSAPARRQGAAIEVEVYGAGRHRHQPTTLEEWHLHATDSNLPDPRDQFQLVQKSLDPPPVERAIQEEHRATAAEAN